MTRVLEILSRAEVVEIPTTAAISRDPKDDKFLATAKVGHCSYVVSEDADLLVLDRYEGIKIVNTVAFLQLLEP